MGATSVDLHSPFLSLKKIVFVNFCCKPPNPHYTGCKVNRPGNEANFKMQYNACITRHVKKNGDNLYYTLFLDVIIT